MHFHPNDNLTHTLVLDPKILRRTRIAITITKIVTRMSVELLYLNVACLTASAASYGLTVNNTTTKINPAILG